MKTRNRNTPRPVDLADRIEAAGYGTAIGQCAADDADRIRSLTRDLDFAAEFQVSNWPLQEGALAALEGVYKRVSRALRTQAGREYLRRGDLREIDMMIRDLKAAAA